MFPFLLGTISGIMRDGLVRMRRRNIAEDTAIINRLDEVAAQIVANGVTVIQEVE
jgi:hypothetical protein